MGKYLDALVKIQNTPAGYCQNRQNPLKNGSGSFVSNSGGIFEKIILLPLREEVLPLTLEWFHERGAAILPDDLRFLRRVLPRETRLRNAAMRRYIKKWRQAADRCPVPHKRENAGRFAANSWIREARGGD